jgi:hypothetical protein
MHNTHTRISWQGKLYMRIYIHRKDGDPDKAGANMTNVIGAVTRKKVAWYVGVMNTSVHARCDFMEEWIHEFKAHALRRMMPQGKI